MKYNICCQIAKVMSRNHEIVNQHSERRWRQHIKSKLNLTSSTPNLLAFVFLLTRNIEVLKCCKHLVAHTLYLIIVFLFARSIYYRSYLLKRRNNCLRAIMIDGGSILPCLIRMSKMLFTKGKDTNELRRASKYSGYSGCSTIPVSPLIPA